MLTWKYLSEARSSQVESYLLLPLLSCLKLHGLESFQHRTFPVYLSFPSSSSSFSQLKIGPNINHA